MSYLSYITDEHLFACIANLHNAYQNAKSDISKKKFYKNKVDTVKLIFDSKFNKLDGEALIQTEINRQIDKSINNSIGTFHEEILGGIVRYVKGDGGYDIKAEDDTLFADIKNKHNTMNSGAAESLFQKLAQYANTFKAAKCYWVQIWAKDSFCEKWRGEIQGKEYSHSRVYKISGDRFYALLTGEQTALFDLYKALPNAIEEYLSREETHEHSGESALEEIKSGADSSGRTILDEITSENYPYYLGFDKLL